MFPLNISLLSELAVKSLTRRGFHTGGRGGGPLNTSNKRGEIRKFGLSNVSSCSTALYRLVSLQIKTKNIIEATSIIKSVN